MQELLQSPWQQAKTFKPHLSSELEVFRRHFRGEQWYVLRRSGSDRLYRVNPQAWQIIGLCDGERTLASIHKALETNFAGISESELLEVICQLMQQGLISLDDPAGAALPKAGKRRERWYSRFKNPLAVRFPLWDPDRFLLRHLPKVAPLFSRMVLVIWSVVVVLAALVGVAHWESITADVVDRVFTPQNLMLLWLIYPATKLVHELAHAFAIKVQGGKVHEIGLMFIYGVALPYVDASDVLTFSHRRQRLLVDGIGIMVELLIASIALAVWLNVSEGLISQLAYNAMIICSVSTLFFNGNPLMRFDGYYLLADWLDIPNLGTRSLLYWRYLLNRYLLGLDRDFEVEAKEWKWLALYGPLSVIYRLTVIVTITLVAAQLYLPVGIAVGVWLLSNQAIVPLWRAFCYLWSTELEGQESRARRLAVAIPLALFFLLVVIPFPVARTLPAVVWMPEQAEIKAGADGWVVETRPTQGQPVVEGELLFRLEDPQLEFERDLAKAKYEEVAARLAAARAVDNIEAQQLQEELNTSKAELDNLRDELQQLVVMSPVAGEFFLPPEIPADHRFVAKGDLLGYVLDRDKVRLRVMVSQDDIGIVRGRSKTLRAKLANWPEQTFAAKLVRINPSASKQLPSAVLGSQYGGDISVDPTDPDGMKTLVDWFQLEVELQPGAAGLDRHPLWAGSRAWVSIDLGYESIAVQLYWVLSQLFMEKLRL